MEDFFKKHKSMVMFGVIVVVMLLVSHFSGGA
jgi:hypothetical protein